MGKEEEERIERETEDFQSRCCPFGWLDVKAAIEMMDRYDKTGDELFEAADEFCDDTGTKFTDLDITAIAYDVILQEVRNRIDELIGFDIVNDAGFYVYGNYACTTFDYGSDDTDKLIAAIKEADEDARDELLADDYVGEWLEDVAIDVEELMDYKAEEEEEEDANN